MVRCLIGSSLNVGGDATRSFGNKERFRVLWMVGRIETHIEGWAERARDRARFPPRRGLHKILL